VSRRIRAIDGHPRHPVPGWQACATAPNAVTEPTSPQLLWGASSAGPSATAAELLRGTGAFSLDGAARRFDAEDWWFRARLPSVEIAPGDELALRIGGIATVADVWLDGAPLLTSDNMFRSHEVLVPRGGGELVIRCRALDALLAAKRPRPRWKTPMVENQQLRWFRTTLLGRTPGWSPPVTAVGPWRAVELEHRRGVVLEDVRLRTELSGTSGVVEVACRARTLGAHAPPPSIELVVERGAHQHGVLLSSAGDGSFAGRLTIADVDRWWPHTHGEPALYRARLAVGGGEPLVADLGALGFRTITRDGDFSLAVNGVPLFCRGACWTPLDVVTLGADPATTARALAQARDAGMNLLRVGGTMTYETDDFYDLLDELGVLLWQDFMFANMDYPEDDAGFVEGVAVEVRQLLARLEARPSLAVLCGNSEVEQQAAMYGAPRERWSPRLFHEVLPALVKERCPDVPYWPSSAHGGAFPHEPRVGTTSYYGVGAYLRPLVDARRSEVRFATECLAFANVPERPPPSQRVHHAAWKARTPRDLGAGWDFDDVRDHYLERVFGVDPHAMRYADHERYLALGRAATGEVMAQVFGEWRRSGSLCRGGLVWFLRDLWAGAGWGVIDAGGAPKSAYFYLRRALAPIAAHVSDEGNSGLYVHLVNDRQASLDGELEVALFRAGEIAVGSARRAVTIPAHSGVSIAAVELFDGFMDLSNAYRFGPPACDLVVATLHARGGKAAQAFHFPLGLPSAREPDVGLTATAHARSDGGFDLALRARRFAQSVVVDADGFLPSDAWFHLPPGGERTIELRRTPGETPPRGLKGTVQALNAEVATKIASPAPTDKPV
jgi:beta-mannosidase